MPRLDQVPFHEVDTFYPFVEEWLQQAIDFAGDRYADGEVLRDCKRGTRQLWLVWENNILGAVVTKIFGRARVCQIELCAGEGIDEWLHLLSELEGWALNQGCAEMEVVGRLGWIKKLKDYDKRAIIMRKKL